MIIPEETIENIRESNDIVDVISEYVALNKKGKSYVGLCPFHKEKTPSFSVSQDKQIFHCFGCGEGGNVITFMMKYHNIDFIEAVRRLADRANIIIPENNGGFDKEKMDLKKKLFKVTREAAAYFYRNLRSNHEGLAYLNKRGIGPDIIRKFGLGFANQGWNDLIDYLKTKGYDEQTVEKAGLVIKKDGGGYYDRFRNRVMFPIFDVRNRIIGFGGRVLDDSKPKYLNSPETLIFNKGFNLYGLNLAAKQQSGRKMIIVEGYMDAIALHQFGINNAVASLGTALTKEQARLLKRYCDEVIICYDADTAGQAATLRGLDILSAAGCKVKILNIPKGKDPDEYVRAEGPDAFRRCYDNAEPLIDYKIRRKSQGFDVSTTEGKIGFVKSCVEVLNTVEDPVTVDAYIKKLANETGISASALYEEMARFKKNGQNTFEKHISGKTRYNNNIDGQKLYLEPAYLKAEKSILSMLYEDSSLFEKIARSIGWDDFNDGVYREIAHIMYEKLKNKENIIPGSVISIFQNPDDMKKAAAIFERTVSVKENDIDKVINDFVNIINKSKLMKRKDFLVSKMKTFEKKGDVEQSVKLLKELGNIEKQLKTL